MVNKSKKILSEISAGELLDKISILEIKLERIKDKNSQEEIIKEYNMLKETNLNLWEIEDKIRICEKNKDYGKNFIELARGIYFTNDKRSKIKSDINKTLGSNIVEIKQYSSY